MSPPSNQDEVTPHTKRLIRLIVSSPSSTDESFSQSLALLSNIASESSVTCLWDLIYILYHSLTREDWYPDDVIGLKGGDKSGSILVKRKNAALALEQIARFIPSHDQKAFFTVEEVVSGDCLWLSIQDFLGVTVESEGSTSDDGRDLLSLVLEKGRILLSSVGKEYDVSQYILYEREHLAITEIGTSLDSSTTNESIEELTRSRIQLQREILTARLGLGSLPSNVLNLQSNTDGNIDEFITDNDLLNCSQTKCRGNKKRSLSKTKETLNTRKKAPKRNKEKESETKTNEDELLQSPLRILLQRALNANMDSTKSHNLGPQNILATELLYQVFHPKWHVRYGALLGLLSLLRAWKRNCQSFKSFGKWPNDILARCVAVLALDRFGDYSGSHFIPVPVREDSGEEYVHEEDLAPVREVAADVLSMLLMWAPMNEVQYPCFKVLSKLSTYKDWEVRHGAMLAFRFIVVRHHEGIHGIYNSCWQEIPRLAILGLTDHSDDLKGASAQVLSTIVSLSLQRRQEDSQNLLYLIRTCSVPLWESVSLLNDVASSTYYLLRLLSEILSENSLLFLESLEGHLNNATARLGMDQVFCRFAEFLFHSLSSVHIACLNAITNIAGPIAQLYRTRDIEVRKKLLIAYSIVTEKLFELILAQGRYDEDEVPHVDIVSELDADESEENTRSQNIVSSMALSKAWRSIINAFDFFFRVADSECKNELHQLISHLLIRLLGRLIGIQVNSNTNIGINSNRIENHYKHGEATVSKEGELFWNIHSACRALSYLYCRPWCQQLDFCILCSIMIAIIQSPWLSMCETGLVFISVLSQQLLLFQNDVIVTQFLEILWSNLTVIVDAVPYSINADAVRDKSLSEEIQLISSCREVFHKILMDMLVHGLLDDMSKSTSFYSTKIHELWIGIHASTPKTQECSDKRTIEIMDIAEMRVLASAACAAITFAPKYSLPQKLTPLVRSLMTSIKNEKNRKRRNLSCKALANLIRHLTSSTPTLYPTRNKIIGTLCSLATEKSPITKEGWVSARIILRNLISDPLYANCMDQLKVIWSAIDALDKRDKEHSDAQKRMNAIDLFWIISAYVPKGTCAFLHVTGALLPSITILACSSTQSPDSATARVSVAQFCKTDPNATLPKVIPTIWHYLNDSLNDIQRTAGALLLSKLVDDIGVFIAPFIRILLPMTMSLMMDFVDLIAKESAASFFRIVRIAPLAASQEPIPVSGFEHLIGAERVIDHLILGKKLPSYQLPNKITTSLLQCNFTLRPYQVEGISWLAFLRSVNLNGALCDDMGLGKTLQAIVSIAIAHSDTKLRKEKASSLVICPSSLTGYWMNELSKFLSDVKEITCIEYVGSPKDRQKIWDMFSAKGDSIFVTSYNILRSDINQLEKLQWTYCVLDEGHLLKNAKSATAKASRRLRSRHKLILSGTPVQNNVQELWAIFDFLMPNYLGSDVEFSARFGKDISRGQLPGASNDDIQRMLYKLRQLHQQVLPFILRREKNQVLNELPPKTITNIPCDLSSIQTRLYQQLSHTQEIQNALVSIDRILEKPIDSDEYIQMADNIDLGALHKLRFICTHPSLLRSEELTANNTNDFSNIECSGKLLALNDLLRAAQIVPSEVTGADNDESLLYVNDVSSSGLYQSSSELDLSDDFNKEMLEFPTDDESLSNCRKCLIYAQFRQSLDAIESFLFKNQMPSLKYLRIDGSVEPQKRTLIVQRFNEDDDIRCLLLTTKVGGLGLNLQAATIVIFLENDWNPHNDLQAMDRAHRLGQSKVVDVYNLVSRNTIEEKIMQVQDRKMKISAAIVNTDNSSMYSMGTENILDLF